MKKNIKKCFALLLAVVMTLTMAMTVFAENATTEGGEYTLTITNQNAYDTAVEYAVYQLFLCNLDANNVPSYTATGQNAALVNGKTVEEVAAMSAEDLYQLVASTKDVTPYNNIKLTTNHAISVPAGYYLVVPTNTAGTADTDNDSLNNEGGTVSAPILVAVPKVDKNTEGNYVVTKDVVVTAKNSKTSHVKKITKVDSVYGTDDTISGSKDTATLGAGDTIEYTITNTVPEYKSDVDLTKVNYFVTDEYDKNLTLSGANDAITISPSLKEGSGIEPVSVTAKNGNVREVTRVKDGDYFVVKEGHKFIVYFNFETIKTATQVIIKAKFTLNNDATPRTDVVNNSKLTYTNNYYTGTDSDLEDQVKSYTFKFNVYKYDTKKETPLGGATFGLYTDRACTDANKIAEVTSGTSGVVDFGNLLNQGTYYVKETTAPNGYRVDDNVYEVVITANTANSEYNGTYTVTVNGNDLSNTVKVGSKIIYTDNIPVLGIGNTPGLTLPGTGGMGTTLFTFGGIALILVACVMFIVYTRKQKKQS